MYVLSQMVPSLTEYYFVTAGKNRKSYLEHIHRFIVCDICGIRPFSGSEIEKFYALLIISMLETLIPFQLLHINVFNDYYSRFFQERVCIVDNTFYCSVWKIHAMLYYETFIGIWTMEHETRYQHLLTQCGEYWIDNAHVMRSTPRGLYGEDVGEAMNHECSQILQNCTTKFRSNSDYQRILQSKYITHYFVNEKSPTLCTQYVIKATKNRQYQEDMQTLNRPDQLRQIFQREGIFITDIEDPLVQMVNAIGFYDTLDKLDWNIKPHSSDPEDEEKGVSFILFLFFLFFLLFLCNLISVIIEENTNNFESKSPLHPTTFGTKVKHIDGVKTPNLSNDRWTLLDIDGDVSHLVLFKNSLQLRGAFFRANDEKQLFRIKWSISDIFRFACTEDSSDTQSPHRYILFKFCNPPTLFIPSGDATSKSQKYYPSTHIFPTLEVKNISMISIQSSLLDLPDTAVGVFRQSRLRGERRCIFSHRCI